MTTALKWKLILGCLLVFLAGGVTGAWVWHAQARHSHHAHHSADAISERMMDHLRSGLDLTPEQVKQIEPIVRQTSLRLEKVRRQTGQEVRAAFQESHDRMTPVLSAEQQKKLEKMERRHKRPGRRHGPPAPPPHE